MYSKFGRQSVHRFLILTQRHSIVARQVKKVKLKRPRFDFQEKCLSPAAVKKLISQSTERTPVRELAPGVQKPSSCFNVQSREAYYQATQPNMRVPPAGNYRCNYQAVRPKVVTPSFDHCPRVTVTPKPLHSPQSIVERPVTRTPPGVPFDKQVPRPETAESPANQLSYRPKAVDKRCATPNMAKYSPRKPTRSLPAPSYSPKYVLVEPTLSTGPDFSKSLERQPLLDKQRCNARQYQPRYNSVDRRVRTPDLSKSLGRSESPLPKHMTSVQSRIGLSVLSDKMLQMNNSFYCVKKPFKVNLFP